MLSLNGFQWSSAPLAWRVFDVVFLFLNAAVVTGVLRCSGWAVAAFIVAAGLQVVLYSLFAGHFATTPDQAEAVHNLLYLNLALLGIFVGLLMLRARNC